MKSQDEPGHGQGGAAQPARGAVQILVANVVLLVSGFGVSVILARGLGPASFGVYGVVISVLVWLERLISAGIPGAAAMQLLRGAEPAAVVAQSARILLMAVTLPLFGGVWVLAPVIAERLDIPSGTLLLRIAAFNLPAMALYFAHDAIFNGLRMFAAQSLLQITQAVAKFAGVLLLYFISLSVTTVLVAHVAATVVAVLLTLRLLQTLGGRASSRVMADMTRTALPMGTYAVAFSLLMNLSLWQLQSAPSRDPVDVGFFVAGLNLTRLMMMVPSTVSGVLFASLTWARANAQHELATKYLQEAVRFALVVTLPACVLIAVDAGGVMELLFGHQYAAGGRVLALLVIAFALIAFIDVLLHALMADGHLMRSAIVLVALVPVLFALNAVMIPGAGGAGAASASVVALGLGVGIAAAMVRARLGSPARGKTLLRVCASSAVVGALSTQVPAAGIVLVVKLGALGGLYGALLWVSGELSVHDLKPLALWKRGR